MDDPSLSETAQIILRSLRDSNPQKPEPLAHAIGVVMDLELYRDAKFYLSQLEGLSLSDEQMFELHEKAGTDFFFRVLTDEAVQPEGKRVAKQVLTAANKVAKSPARIGELIKTLNHPNISVRSEAFRKLRRLGEPAVAELVSVFGDPSRSAEYPGAVRRAETHGRCQPGPAAGGGTGF